MKKLLLLILLSGPLTAADNEIFLDQSSGASNTNIDLEQLGSGNIIGGSDAAARGCGQQFREEWHARNDEPSQRDRFCLPARHRCAAAAPTAATRAIV